MGVINKATMLAWHGPYSTAVGDKAIGDFVGKTSYVYKTTGEGPTSIPGSTLLNVSPEQANFGSPPGADADFTHYKAGNAYLIFSHPSALANNASYTVDGLITSTACDEGHYVGGTCNQVSSNGTLVTNYPETFQLDLITTDGNTKFHITAMIHNNHPVYHVLGNSQRKCWYSTDQEQWVIGTYAGAVEDVELMNGQQSPNFSRYIAEGSASHWSTSNGDEVEVLDS